jgi:flagellar biosynthesis chaperone FliJ
MSFPLQSLLDLRRSAEEAAERALAASVAARAAAEEEQRRLQEDAAAARERAATRPAYDGAAHTAGAALEGERFQARLAAQAGAAGDAALTHREGALALARDAEERARRQHATARRDRQAVEEVLARTEAETRRLAERRSDDVASDLAAGRGRGK